MFQISKGTIEFDSDAPLELIKASTEQVQGIIDADNKAFAFIAPVASFEGFNSPLQKTHFDENYIEAEKYPKARFFGRIEGEFDLERYGIYNVVGNGTLKVHGVEKKYKVPVVIHVDDYGARISSKFEILLKDHKIKVPTIMRLKIAEAVYVNIEAEFERKF